MSNDIYLKISTLLSTPIGSSCLSQNETLQDELKKLQNMIKDGTIPSQINVNDARKMAQQFLDDLQEAYDKQQNDAIQVKQQCEEIKQLYPWLGMEIEKFASYDAKVTQFLLNNLNLE